MQTGIGVMLHHLFGRNIDVTQFFGRKILKAEFVDDKLSLYFENGKAIKIYDDGQSCCEDRYMRTDDDVQWLVGKVLKDMNIKEAPSQKTEGDYGDHEVQFFEIETNEGCITFSSHNEHNGYYGGFAIKAEEIST